MKVSHHHCHFDFVPSDSQQQLNYVESYAVITILAIDRNKTLIKSKKICLLSTRFF